MSEARGTAPGVPEQPTRGTGRRTGRGRAVLVVLALAVAALAGGVPVWLRTAGTSALRGDVPVTVSGTEAAPGVPAAALVLLAASVAVALAGRFGRWVVVAVVVLAGLLLSASAVALITDPDPVARTAVAAATGVDTLTAPVSLTPWPWVTGAVGVLVLAAGCWLAATSRAWARPSERHDRRSAGTPAPAAAASGALAPSAAAGSGTARSAGAVPSPPAAASRPEPDDDQAAWDALTRGHDPT